MDLVRFRGRKGPGCCRVNDACPDQFLRPSLPKPSVFLDFPGLNPLPHLRNRYERALEPPTGAVFPKETGRRSTPDSADAPSGVFGVWALHRVMPGLGPGIHDLTTP